MKKIGIVGGVGWPSTVEYYTGICRYSERRHVAEHLCGAPSMPEMCIESLDINKAVTYIGTDADEASWAQFDEYHRAALRRIESSGAEFAVIASNTSHHRFAEITRGIGIPVLSIFEVVARKCAQLEARRVLILGTAPTMESSICRTVFAEYGIDATGPKSKEARISIIEVISQLQRGETEGTATRIREIAKTSCHNWPASNRVICLACTELPLAFLKFKEHPVFELDGIMYVNTSAVHIAAAFDYAVSE